VAASPTASETAARALLDRIAKADDITHRQRDAYLRSACVLASVRDPDALKPFGVTALSSALQVLGPSLKKSPARAFAGEYVLDPDARTDTLKEMTQAQIKAALELNPHERRGPGQRMFEYLLLGTSPDLGVLEGQDLEMAVQLMIWLRSVRPLDDELKTASARLEYARYLAPFEALASDTKFVGREQELDEMREHVGVLPPESYTRRLRAALTPTMFKGHKPALSIFGPGGVGKSTLVARFALEHLRLPPERRIPLAYLDFDRPDRDIADIGALAAEIIRQVEAQRGGGAYRELLERAESLVQLNEETRRAKGQGLAAAASKFAGDPVPEPEGATDVQQIEAVTEIIGELLVVLAKQSVPGPLVLILDSFEEVQYRNEARAQAFWDVLNRTAGLSKELRTVISGRAPVRSLTWNGVPATELQVGELDEPAAQAFLKSRGFMDAAERRNIIRVVGRMPLSLVLVATLLASESGGVDSLQGVSGKRSLWFSASDEVIQGQLYERILGHIHNPRVRKLAHPGLVLRRVTPDLIEHVLNAPCNLGIESSADARSLLEELKRETSLVTIDLAEDAVVHRRDLRAVMLKLMEAKDGALVRTIHAGAAAWFEAKHDLRSRAEYCYHTLHLGQFPERWLLDSEIRSSIQASISDFAPDVQENLYRINYLRENGEDSQPSPTYDQLIVSIEAALPYARLALRGRENEVRKAFQDEQSLRMAVLGWRMYTELLQPEVALEWQQRADKCSVLEPNLRQRLLFLSEKCWYLYRSGDQSEMIKRGYLDGFVDHARRLRENWAIAQACLLDDLVRESERAWHESPAAILRLESTDLWDIFPIVGVACKQFEWTMDSFVHLAHLIVDSSGPLARAELGEADRARFALLQGAMEALTMIPVALDGQRLWCRNLASLMANLAHDWPYQVLRVQPAFSSRSYKLSEAMA
jgi:hypothetical protein